jgi:hypothetical protein
VNGPKVNWTVKCAGFMPLEMIGEVIFAGETYTGTMQTNFSMGGQTMSTNSTFSGKRIGDCTK